MRKFAYIEKRSLEKKLRDAGFLEEIQFEKLLNIWAEHGQIEKSKSGELYHKIKMPDINMSVECVKIFTEK